jgi:hypothetical protein
MYNNKEANTAGHDKKDRHMDKIMKLMKGILTHWTIFSKHSTHFLIPFVE